MGDWGFDVRGKLALVDALLTCHAVRFLKTPRVLVEKGTVVLRAVLVVTTDLGETFYPHDLELVVAIREVARDGNIYLRRRIMWGADSRALPISFDLSHQDIDWPACVHVAPRHGSTEHSGFMPAIVDVWSGSMNPVRGAMDSGHRVERRFTSLAEREVSLLEDAGDSIARHLWDGSQALAQHLDQTIALQTPTSLPLLELVLVSATYRKLNVIELGCGCGTVGISLAQAIPDCDVVLTDLPDVSDLVHANIQRMRPAMCSKVSFEPLDWEQRIPETLINRINDLIIVSECTYNADTLQALVGTLLALTVRSPKAVIIVATKTRHPSEAAFFSIARDVGLIEEGSMRISLPGIPGSGFGDTATDVGLHIFHGKEHRLSISPSGSEEKVTQIPRSGGARPRSSRRTTPS